MADHNMRELHALLFTNSVHVGSLTSHMYFKGFETGPPAYSPYPRRLEPFADVITNPECWPGVELTTSRESAQCSTN